MDGGGGVRGGSRVVGKMVWHGVGGLVEKMVVLMDVILNDSHGIVVAWNDRGIVGSWFEMVV